MVKLQVRHCEEGEGIASSVIARSDFCDEAISVLTGSQQAARSKNGIASLTAFARNDKERRGVALAEYIWVIGIVAGALILVNVYLIRGIQGHLQAITDRFIGTDQTDEYVSYNATGGKQLVQQNGLYAVSGETSTDLRTQVRQREFGDGLRDVEVLETMGRQSPGWGFDEGFEVSPLPEYKFVDQDKAPLYVAPFVLAEDGYITPPQRE